MAVAEVSGADAPIALGRVIDAWGVNGWVKVEPYSAASDTTLTRAPRWHLVRSMPRSVIGPKSAALFDPEFERWVNIERARRHSAGVVAKLQGIEDRTGALALKGAEVGVLRTDFPALPAGEYYWVDLIGRALINACLLYNSDAADE